MLTSEFDYPLPEELIAHHPPARRGDSRLLCLERDSGAISHHQFNDLPQLLQPGDLLVFNNTRVIPARLFGNKDTGGKIELLVERLLSDKTALVQLRASKTPRPGTLLLFPPEPRDGGSRHQPAGIPVADADPLAATVLDREGDFFRVGFNCRCSLAEYLEHAGQMPLPPYIRREDQQSDRERYQTVYGRVPGAVAAPTAGLHFNEELLRRLKEKTIDTTFVTLHVGAGTFQPVRVDDIREHRMHSEWLQVPADAVDRIRACKDRGGRVVAVGTTAVRSLETAARQGAVAPFEGETDIFIYPGFRFQAVDAMITNFHLPQSTLLMLVSAFAGKEKIHDAYRTAIQEKYRFFSYGDAMLIS